MHVCRGGYGGRYIKDEQKNLKRELLRAQEEVKRIQSVPLVIGQVLLLPRLCLSECLGHKIPPRYHRSTPYRLIGACAHSLD